MSVLWKLLLYPALAISLVFGISACGDSKRSPETTVGRFRQVDDFLLTNQKAEPVTRAAFLGKVWVANFMFTSCGAECLILSRKMAILQDRFSDREDVAFASFSVDPHTDKPERLTVYGDRFGADPEKWQLLTGDTREIDRVIKQSFLLPVARSDQEKLDLLASNFIHSDKLAIVDRQGVVRAYVDGMDPEAVEQVSGVIRQLLAEPAG